MEKKISRNSADEISEFSKSGDVVTLANCASRITVSAPKNNCEDLGDECYICGLATGDQCLPACEWEPYTMVFAMR